MTSIEATNKETKQNKTKANKKKTETIEWEKRENIFIYTLRTGNVCTE